MMLRFASAPTQKIALTIVMRVKYSDIAGKKRVHGLRVAQIVDKYSHPPPLPDCKSLHLCVG